MFPFAECPCGSESPPNSGSHTKESTTQKTVTGRLLLLHEVLLTGASSCEIPISLKKKLELLLRYLDATTIVVTAVLNCSYYHDLVHGVFLCFFCICLV